MSTTTSLAPASPPLPALARSSGKVSRLAARCVAAVRRAWQDRQAQRALVAMDNRMLRDIGMRRAGPDGPFRPL